MDKQHNYVHLMLQYSAKTNTVILIYATARINFKNMLREADATAIYSMILFVWDVQKRKIYIETESRSVIA